LNLFSNGDFSNADEWTWNRLDIARWDGVTGAVFLFVDFRGAIVFPGVMRRSEGPLLLLTLDMLVGGRKEQASQLSQCLIESISK